MESGRTSSVGNDILGFDSVGNVVNKPDHGRNNFSPGFFHSSFTFSHFTVVRKSFLEYWGKTLQKIQIDDDINDN